MSVSFNLPPLRQPLVYIERLKEYRSVRAVMRATSSCVPVGALFASLSDLPDAIGTDRLIDLGFAGVSAAAFLWLMHRFGRGRGIVFGCKVTAISYLFWQSLVIAAYATWIAAGMNGVPTDWGFVGFSAGLSAALFIPTYIGLTRLDP